MWLTLWHKHLLGFEGWIRCFGWFTTLCRRVTEFWCSSELLSSEKVKAVWKMCQSVWEKLLNILPSSHFHTIEDKPSNNISSIIWNISWICHISASPAAICCKTHCISLACTAPDLLCSQIDVHHLISICSPVQPVRAVNACILCNWAAGKCSGAEGPSMRTEPTHTTAHRERYIRHCEVPWLPWLHTAVQFWAV